MVEQDLDLLEVGAMAGTARASIYVMQLDAAGRSVHDPPRVDDAR